MDERYPCPCCGHLTFREPPGSYDICPLCFWEDDNIQLRWPDWATGANKASLIQAQRNFVEFGASEQRLIKYVRPPTPTQPIEPGWRPVDLNVDVFEPLAVQQAPWPDDLTVLYWWRPTFWRDPRRGHDHA